jgi:alpha-amylase
MVSVDGGTPFKLTHGGTFTIGENTIEGGQVNVKVTASNAEDTVTKSFTYNKKDPNATISIYFDNTSYKWSQVNAYIYDESGSSVVNNGAWPGQAMTYNASLGLYEIEVPDKLWGSEARVIFTEGASSANRYPADMQPGLQISGESHKFSSGNSWEVWKPVVPTNPPTKPTENPYTTVYMGDVDGDSQITLVDTLMVQKAILGGITLSKTQLLAADVDSSKAISVSDVIILMRHQVGYENTYGVATYKQILSDTVVTV